MDLMTASTSYQQLQSKYEKFRAPTVCVLVDGTDITQNLKTHLSRVTADLTCGYAASGVSFDVIGEYEYEQNSFSAKGVAKVLQLGARVELKLGYIRTETVFSGLIAEVRYEFEEDESPYIHVECMDAKCLLMKTQRLEIRSEKKIAPIVSALLGAQPVSTYLSGRTVDLQEAEKLPLPFNMESDYDFLVRQAQYTGCEFFIFAGKAYFRRPPASSTPVMTLEPRQGIARASFSLRGAPLVKKVTVVGVDPDSDASVSGSASAQGSFGKGAGPGRMLSGTERTYFDARAMSAKDAADRAKVLMSGIQQQFGQLTCRCIGLPELVPGRWIRIKGLMPEADTGFYITDVRHVYSQNGFTTTFDARISSL